MTRLRIALVAQGRFHMFDLARELVHKGHDVVLFTNYPKRACQRFGVPRASVVNWTGHGAVSRAAARLLPAGLAGSLERCSNTAFGRWAAGAVHARRPWDVVASMSGVAEDAFKAVSFGTAKLLYRLSSHIRTQRQLLEQERSRSSSPWIEAPSDWIIAREEREYQQADLILVPAGFAHRSFLARGVPADRLCEFRSGVNCSGFAVHPDVVARRVRRIRAGEPLNVLNVGTFCLRKGAWDWNWLLNRAEASRFRFRFVGPVAADARYLERQLRHRAQFTGALPQAELPSEYAQGDLFVLPTLEDGAPFVLVQALACGVPILCSDRCNSTEIIDDELNGWVIPPACPEALLDRLEWIDSHRGAYAELVERIGAQRPDHLDWATVADDLLNCIRRSGMSKGAGRCARQPA